MNSNYDYSDDSSYECSEEEQPKISKRFFCKQCKKRFSSKLCLKEHSYKHKNVKPYKCQICKQSFRHSSQFTVHRQSHKSSREISWPTLAELESKQVVNIKHEYCLNDEIELPKISKPYLVTLPSLSSILKFNSL